MFTLSKTWFLALFFFVTVFELFSGCLNILVARRLGKLEVGKDQQQELWLMFSWPQVLDVWSCLLDLGINEQRILFSRRASVQD